MSARSRVQVCHRRRTSSSGGRVRIRLCVASWWHAPAAPHAQARIRTRLRARARARARNTVAPAPRADQARAPCAIHRPARSPPVHLTGACVVAEPGRAQGRRHCLRRSRASILKCIRMARRRSVGPDRGRVRSKAECAVGKIDVRLGVHSASDRRVLARQTAAGSPVPRQRWELLERTHTQPDRRLAAQPPIRGTYERYGPHPSAFQLATQASTSPPTPHKTPSSTHDTALPKGVVPRETPAPPRIDRVPTPWQNGVAVCHDGIPGRRPSLRPVGAEHMAGATSTVISALPSGSPVGPASSATTSPRLRHRNAPLSEALVLHRRCESLAPARRRPAGEVHPD